MTPRDCVHCPHNLFKKGISYCKLNYFEDLPSTKVKCIYEYKGVQKCHTGMQQ